MAHNSDPTRRGTGSVFPFSVFNVFTYAIAGLIGLSVALVGCDRSATPPAGQGGAPSPSQRRADDDRVGQDHDADDHAGHVHAAPHQGTLVALGEHFAHLELLLDPGDGSLRVYALDAEADKPVRLAQPEIALRILLPTGGAAAAGVDELELRLRAVENVLTGEKVGDSSEFEGAHERLKGVTRFRGTIRHVTIRGQAFENVAFRFPEGSEAAETHREAP